MLDAFGLLPSVTERATTIESMDLKRYDNGKLLISITYGKKIVQTMGAPWMYVHTLLFTDYHLLKGSIGSYTARHILKYCTRKQGTSGPPSSLDQRFRILTLPETPLL